MQHGTAKEQVGQAVETPTENLQKAVTDFSELHLLFTECSGNGLESAYFTNKKTDNLSIKQTAQGYPPSV